VGQFLYTKIGICFAPGNEIVVKMNSAAVQDDTVIRAVEYRYTLHNLTSPFFYPQDPNYGILHTISHFSTLIKNKKFWRELLHSLTTVS
jgi:hypothetical protein